MPDVEHGSEGARSLAGALEVAWQSLDIPARHPAADDMLWDDAGTLWVRRGGQPPTADRHWDAFDLIKNQRFHIVVPARFDVGMVAAGRIWGVRAVGAGGKELVVLDVAEQ